MNLPMRVLVAGLMLVGALPSGSALAATGSISGTVTDESASPLADIDVTVCSIDFVCDVAFTDASGAYSIAALPSGEYRVRFAASSDTYVPEYYDNATDRESATPVPVAAGSDTAGIDALLKLGGSVSGTITNESAAPLVDMFVVACTTDDSVCKSTFSTVSGSYQVGGLPTGEYVVEFSDPFFSAYSTEYYDNAVDRDSATLVPVSAGSDTPGINAALAPPGSISGTVTDGSANPVEGITVDVCTEDWSVCVSALSGVSGAYTVGGLPAGRYIVFFFDPADRYFEEFYDNVVSRDSATPVSVVAGSDTPGIDAVLVQQADGLFVDTDGSVFEADIEWLSAAGITRGCGRPADRTYCPDEPLTRGQLAAFLVRALGLTDDGGGDRFEDDGDSIFESDIDRLASAGITRGCNPPDNTRFCPQAWVTRGQLAAFLVRAMGYTDDGGGDRFEDDGDSVFERDIERLAAAGVTRGCNPPDNTRYCPDSLVTRGQISAFLHRAIGDVVIPAATHVPPTGSE